MCEQQLVSDPNVMMGKPVVAGTRFTVEEHGGELPGAFAVLTVRTLRIRSLG
jgi:hypothetical protein